MAELSPTLTRPAGETSPGPRPLRIAVFSPLYGVGGPVAGFRWWFLSRYLAALGAEVTVFHETADPQGLRGIPVAGGAAPREVCVPLSRSFLMRLSRLASRAVDRLTGLRPGRLRTFLLLLCEQLYILATSGRRGVRAFDREYRGRARPDVIIASCVGWAGVTPALALRRRGIPFVLEFRDPWKHYHPDTWPYHVRRVEHTAAQALATINVTPVWCDEDARDFRREVLYIPHGYPPEILDLPARPAAGGAACLQVGYFGNILYPGFRYEDWFRGLAARPAGEVQFHYAGREFEGVQARCRELGAGDRVTAESGVPLDEVFRRQRGLDALVTFTWADPDKPGHFGFKLPEILAARRPVLVVGPEDQSVRDFLTRGTRVLWAHSAAEVAQRLGELAAEKRQAGSVRTSANDAVIREQAWDRIARRLLAELDRLVPDRRGSRTEA